MISCQRFVFLLTSGELDESGWLTRMQAGQHRLVCRRCRAFAANDRMLSEILSAQRERLQRPEADGLGEASPGGADLD